MLRIENVSKSYGGVIALKGVTFKLEAKSITGLVGPNGAGKTTLFDILSGYSSATSGRVLLNDFDITNSKPDRIARRGLARTFQTTRLARKLSVGDHLCMATGKHNPSKWLCLQECNPLDQCGYFQAVLEKFGLKVSLRSVVDSLSFTEQKLLTFALCEVARREVILLDEPFSGLEGVTIKCVCDQIRRWKAGGISVLLVEHNVRAVREISDSIIVLKEGQIASRVAPSEFSVDAWRTS